MALGPLPYKAKVTSAVPAPSGDMLLTISVLDNSAAVRATTQTLYPQASFQDSAAARNLFDMMVTLAIQQFLTDAGDFATAITSISASVGG